MSSFFHPNIKKFISFVSYGKKKLFKIKKDKKLKMPLAPKVKHRIKLKFRILQAAANKNSSSKKSSKKKKKLKIPFSKKMKILLFKYSNPNIFREGIYPLVNLK